ncbi:3D domain-containing protein [Paenibacillus sp. J5C2022]|uniref:3D domain-containing protein n=1 Tax=Paenibacillus sp. J5C2022 TaxID=2977129 RepID=UPI0021D0B980|nr:3D domain-containing protein [Paenibacillus sp. J5C2022]
MRKANVIVLILTLVSVLLTVPQPEQTEVVEIADEGWVTFEATAYTARCDGCTGITKTGVDIRESVMYEGLTVIAVDPDVIPLGSAVEIRLSDGAIIEGTAQDVGAAIKGRRIDIAHATKKAAYAFGRQDVEVRIINEYEAEE